MKAENYNTVELNQDEMKQTNGGFIFLLTIAFVAVETAIAWSPVVGSAIKGWEDGGK